MADDDLLPDGEPCRRGRSTVPPERNGERSRRAVIAAVLTLIPLGGCGKQRPSIPNRPTLESHGAGPTLAGRGTGNHPESRLRTPSPGTGRTSSSPPNLPDLSFEFERRIRAVADLGMDPTGNRPIDDALESVLQNRTLIEFEPGTYITSRRHDIEFLEDWGIRGIGSSRGAVRIRPPTGEWLYFLNVQSGRNILVNNVTFDMLDTWHGAIGNVFSVSDGLHLKDVEYAGRHPNQRTGTATLIVVRIRDPDGTGIVDGFVKQGPTELTEFPNNAITLFSGSGCNGTLYLLNSHFENSGEHGAYVSHTDGPVRIWNCTFKNNQNSHARISGAGSWVRHSRFIWDIADHPNKGSFQSQTGLVWEAGNTGKESGGDVENCEFDCRSSAANSGCLKIDGSHGTVRVTHCHFRVHQDGVAPIVAESPGSGHLITGLPLEPWGITLRNLHITGAGIAHPRTPGAINLLGRDGSVIDGVGIDLHGSRMGLYLTDGTYFLRDMDIEAAVEPITTVNAAIEHLPRLSERRSD